MANWGMEQPIDLLALFRAYEREYGRYENHVDLNGLAQARAHQGGENVGVKVKRTARRPS